LRDVQKETEDPDYGLNGLFGDGAGLNYDWGTLTPRVELGARPKVGNQALEHAQIAPPPRGAEVGPTVAGMSLEQLRWVVQAIVNERPSTVTQVRGCDNNKR